MRTLSYISAVIALSLGIHLLFSVNYIEGGLLIALGVINFILAFFDMHKKLDLKIKKLDLELEELKRNNDLMSWSELFEIKWLFFKRKLLKYEGNFVVFINSFIDRRYLQGWAENIDADNEKIHNKIDLFFKDKLK